MRLFADLPRFRRCQRSRLLSRNKTRTVYALKCDIRQFFASVGHGRLLELHGQQVTDERVLGLVTTVLDRC